MAICYFSSHWRIYSVEERCPKTPEDHRFFRRYRQLGDVLNSWRSRRCCECCLFCFEQLLWIDGHKTSEISVEEGGAVDLCKIPRQYSSKIAVGRRWTVAQEDSIPNVRVKVCRQQTFYLGCTTYLVDLLDRFKGSIKQPKAGLIRLDEGHTTHRYSRFRAGIQGDVWRGACKLRVDEVFICWLDSHWTLRVNV